MTNTSFLFFFFFSMTTINNRSAVNRRVGSVSPLPDSQFKNFIRSHAMLELFDERDGKLDVDDYMDRLLCTKLKIRAPRGSFPEVMMAKYSDLEDAFVDAASDHFPNVTHLAVDTPSPTHEDTLTPARMSDAGVLARRRFLGNFAETNKRIETLSWTGVTGLDVWTSIHHFSRLRRFEYTGLLTFPNLLAIRNISILPASLQELHCPIIVLGFFANLAELTNLDSVRLTMPSGSKALADPEYFARVRVFPLHL